MKRGSLLVIVLSIASIALAVVTYGLLQAQKRITTTVLIKSVGVGVYLDSNATVPVVQIDWGMKEPNTTSYYSVYIRNEGNSDAVLSLTTEDWNPPEAANYITLDWTYNGTTLSPSQIIPVNFILTIAPDINGITAFSFVIVIIIVG